jgi:hypothetical protein
VTPTVGAGVTGTVTVTGTGFPTTAVVLWNGAPLATTRLSSTRLDAQLPAARTGQIGDVAQVGVRAAAGGGDATGSLPVAVVEPPPPPPPPVPSGPGASGAMTAPPQLGVPRLRALNHPRAGGRLRLTATSSRPGNGARLLLQQRAGARWVTLRATALRGRALALRLRVPAAGRLVLRVRLQAGRRARASRPLAVRILPRLGAPAAQR